MELIYSHCLIKFNLSNENDGFATTVFKIFTFQYVSHFHALEIEFDLDIK